MTNSRCRPSAWSLAAAAAITMAGCSAQPHRVAEGSNRIDPKYGVAASPRVVADGEPVPRGGGAYLVGRPYTIAGKRYYPSERLAGYSVTGTASWYGDAFHGRRTANGETFDKQSISAAHPTMPLPSYARVTNIRNNHSIIVRVNDRGPYHGGRVMDVSQRVAEALDFKRYGTTRVRVDYVAGASLDGSDDNKLIATLRLDGAPASLDGNLLAPTMLAQRPPDSSRVALAVPQPQSVRTTPVSFSKLSISADEAASSPVVPEAFLPTRAGALPARAPLPPARPFDLGRNPNFGMPVALGARQWKMAHAIFHSPAVGPPI